MAAHNVIASFFLRSQCTCIMFRRCFPVGINHFAAKLKDRLMFRGFPIIFLLQIRPLREEGADADGN